VDLPGAISLGDHAFYGCSSLSVPDLPNVLYLGTSAFKNCGALAALSLPRVEFIGNNAFSGCFALRSLILGDIPPDLGGITVFPVNKPIPLLYVPSGATAVYAGTQKENWTDAIKAQVRDLGEYR
jgi:hypothetical protein